MDETKHRIYGRRKGHKLRKGQARLMQEVLPQLRIDLEQPAPLDPAGLFGSAVDTHWLEIGFGAGEHLLWQAQTHADTGIIGCEPFVNGVAQLLARLETDHISNVRIHDGDARDVLDCLAADSISRIFLLFPDPWPKLRHNKRRFVTQENLERLARVLAPGGEFRFASDIPDYVRWTLSHIRRQGVFEWLADGPGDWRHRPSDWPQTRYESKAVQAGRRPSYLRFRLPH